MLTDQQIKAAKPGFNPNIDRETGKPRGPTDKAYKLPKEDGLTIQVDPNGVKRWLHFITINGRTTTLAYGTYPEVKLREAREKRDETRRLVRSGIDPVAQKRAEKASQADTFKAIAEEWLEAGCPGRKKRSKAGRVKDETIGQLRHRLETYVYPHHGSRPIKDIKTPELHATLKRIVSKGRHETALRVRSVTSRVFRFAIATGRAEYDPAAALVDALPGAEVTHFAAITEPTEIGALLRAIDTYNGQPTVIAALKLAPYLFVRPSELRGMEWAELQLDGDEPRWTIPPARTKMGREHVVPLPRQAVEILTELHKHTGHLRLVFPSIRSRERPISENTLNSALRRLDYTSEQMTAHGFRTMASTRLNELGHNRDLIEVQLAHLDKDRIRSIYNRAEYMDQRRQMMQSYADYLDALKADEQGKVVAIGGRR